MGWKHHIDPTNPGYSRLEIWERLPAVAVDVRPSKGHTYREYTLLISLHVREKERRHLH